MEPTSSPTEKEAADSLKPSPAQSALNGSVLVLNKFYMAVHVISVRRALVLLYRELAEVIHVENGHSTITTLKAGLKLVSSKPLKLKTPKRNLILPIGFEASIFRFEFRALSD